MAPPLMQALNMNCHTMKFDICHHSNIHVQKYLLPYSAIFSCFVFGGLYWTKLGQSPIGFFFRLKSKEALEFILKFFLNFQTNMRKMTSAGQPMFLNLRFLQHFSFEHTCISSSESDSSISNLESTSRSASGTSRSNREKKIGLV